MRVIEATEMADSKRFAAICEAALGAGVRVRFRARGQSMQPNVLDGDVVEIEPATEETLQRGDIALTRGGDRLLLHRATGREAASRAVVTRGDACMANDAPADAVFGKVISVERSGRKTSSVAPGTKVIHSARKHARRLARAVVLRADRLRALFLPLLFLAFGMLLHAPAAHAQFTITDSANPTTVAPGGTVTYTQVLTCNGGGFFGCYTPSRANPATTSQTIDANTTYVSYAVTGTARTHWTCGLTGSTLACSDTSGGTRYNNGNTTTFTVTVTVGANTPDGTVINNTVTANPGNSSASANVTVQVPDLSMTQTETPNPVATGASITYTETVSNLSGVTASGATLTQNTPANTVFASATPPAGWTCGTTPGVGGTGAIACTATGTLTANSTSGNFTITVTVIAAAPVGATITNAATVSETGTDPNLGNNTTTTTTTVSGADLGMTQIVSAPAVAPGAQITYSETVTNYGPDAATNAVLYQETPANTTFSSMTAPAGWACGTQPASGGTGQVICTDANVNSGVASGSFTFVVTVTGTTAAGTTISNPADVTAQTTDSLPSNNTTTTSVLVESATGADLSVSMTAAPTPVFVSSPLSYSIQVQNLGLTAASGVTVTDTLPTGLTAASATTTQGSCGAPSGGKIVCTIGTVPYPQTSAISITISGMTPGTATTLTNSASVAPTGSDPVLTNNTATVLTVVQPLVCATPGKDGTPGSPLSGYVNTYYGGVGTANAGTNTITVSTPSTGSSTQLGAGDLALVIQMQGATINSTNTSSYGNGNPGYPAAGSLSFGNSGEYEFVTISAITVNANTDTLTIVGTGASGGFLNSYATVAASATQGAQTFQVIRVPQYSSAVLSSSLAAYPWDGAKGGVLALDVASQLTLGGTVSLDGDGFRGGGGVVLGGQAGMAATDIVTLSTQKANGSKGEGIAGTPLYVAPALSSITTTTTATNTGQTYTEGLPNGSYARGAPGNAGGGATDADPSANDQNDGGGGGGNGGTGGQGGFAWESAGTVGGFGGVNFPANTGSVVMGGGGGAGTSNNGAWWDPVTNTGNANCGTSCTGIYSSGTAGGGIVIIRAGSVTGMGTITASGQNALDEENDGAGGGGAGGSIQFYVNSGGLSGLTAIADGGNGGSTWPDEAPGATFPGNRHGPGGGGGGGLIFASSAPAGGAPVTGGEPGYTTLADDAYGATAGQPGIVVTGESITETPGTQSGAYCAGADVAVTNSAAPNPVVAGSNITYTQQFTNSGPQDAVNATLNEPIPANTTYQSYSIAGASASGWNCTTPAVGAIGTISCTNSDVSSGANGAAVFSVQVNVDPGTASGTQIADTVSVASGTNDPNLTNNSATAVVIVADVNSADLSITETASPNPVQPSGTLTYTVTVSDAGPASASSVVWNSATPASTAFGSVTYFSGTTGWTCSPTSISCSIGTLAPGTSTTFKVTVTVNSNAVPGTTITDTATVSSSTSDPNPASNVATTTVVVATAAQSDLAVTKTGTPTTVLAGNKITYTLTVTNNGPSAMANPVLTDTFSSSETVTSTTPWPAGWTCSAPAGTQFTCDGPASMAVNSGSPATFKFVMTVTAGSSPGTIVTNTASIGPTMNGPIVIDPYTANNTASTSSTVASPTQADVAIVKTVSSQTVIQGTNLVYTLQVTNNGPAVAQNLTVTDSLPAQVTFVSVSIPASQGTCSQSAGTVTCTIPSLSVGGLAIITIDTTAESSGAPANVANTASVAATTSDPNLTNNTSTVNSAITAPTAVELDSFTAQMRAGGGVVLRWRTREETRNLGFHVYREDATGRHRLDPSLIAGSALFFRGGLPQHRARTYGWIDPQGGPNASYWLEDVDLNGTSTMHGPIYAEARSQSTAPIGESRLLTQLNQAIAAQPSHVTHGLATPPPAISILTPPMAAAWFDNRAAVKISVSSEGWYEVTGAQLAAAGLPANANVRDMALYAEGVEQPMLIVGAKRGALRANDAIEFYGTGIDTPFSGTRVYWLTSGSRPGMQILSIAAVGRGAPSATSFPFSVLLQQRTTYFAALLNGENNDNFFGAVVDPTPVDQVLTVANIDPASAIPTTLTVTLQGVMVGQDHRVDVALNGLPLGEIDFSGQANTTSTFPVNAGVLQNGNNTVTLTAMDGEYDVSLVQSIQLNYAHTYTADSDWLRTTAAAGETVRIDGFTEPSVEVFDVTNPVAIVQLKAPVTSDGSSYGVTLSVDGQAGSQRTLLAFAADQISVPDALAYHAPSTLAENETGANYIVITHRDFSSSVAPLVKLHESEGESVAVVTTDQIYDAYNYGEHSPFALRDYLQFAATKWRVRPSAVLLVGDASLDPRNYLGFGNFDFVPTRMIETAAFKTASDDWLTDFNQTGFATIPTGRLPVRTPDEAALLVSKIVNYESGTSAGSWQNQAVVIADQKIDADFTSAANAATAVLAPSLQVNEILADGQDPTVVQPQILSALNRGALLVNYTGHGSEEEWSFADLFDDTAATALNNGNQLPMYVLMDCLNGFFQDVYATSLSTSLMLAPNGGAVAVWASSGFTDAPPQATMDQAFLSAWVANPQGPIGTAILSAKSGITDADVRRTWILFGDPEMRLKIPSSMQSTQQHMPRATHIIVRVPKPR